MSVPTWALALSGVGTVPLDGDMHLYVQVVTLRIKHMASTSESQPAGWHWATLLDLQTSPESVEVVSATANVRVDAPVT